MDHVDRRFRDAIKFGAPPLMPPRDEVGLGAWRRTARLGDPETGADILIWQR